MSTAPVKAFAYLRVSGKGQIDGDGFARQEKAIRSYAAAHNIHVVEVFREKGVSGKTDLENRPALMALLEALAANGTRLVLIEKLDRLARELMTQETIIGDLRKRGFELVSVMEPDLLQDDAGRKMMRQIFGAIAEYEKAMIVAKLRGARERTKARDGRCEGRKPYGERAGEQEIIERMRALRASGATFQAIAEQFNREQVPTRAAGRNWHASTVQRIIERA